MKTDNSETKQTKVIDQVTPYFVLLTSSSQPHAVITGSSLLRSPSKKYFAGQLGEVQLADSLQLLTPTGSASAFYQRPRCFWEAHASDWTWQCGGRGDGRISAHHGDHLMDSLFSGAPVELSQTVRSVLQSDQPVSSPLWSILGVSWASQVVQTVQNLPTVWETQVKSPNQEDLLEKGMATHFSILAWETPWTEEPGKLQFMGLQRVGHDWATYTHT